MPDEALGDKMLRLIATLLFLVSISCLPVMAQDENPDPNIDWDVSLQYGPLSGPYWYDSFGNLLTESPNTDCLIEIDRNTIPYLSDDTKEETYIYYVFQEGVCTPAGITGNTSTVIETNKVIEYFGYGYRWHLLHQIRISDKLETHNLHFTVSPLNGPGAIIRIESHWLVDEFGNTTNVVTFASH